MLNQYLRIGIGVIAICMSLAFANVPQTITFQGRLTESGIPVEGTRTMRFAIVNTTGTAVWSNSDSSVAISQGIYTFELGTTPPLTPAILDTADKLSIRVWVEGTQLSDIPLNSAPYAYLAANAATANNLVQMGATTGQVLKFNGTTWAPGTDNNTPSIYTAGSGLLLTGSTFSIASQNATNGQVLKFNGTTWVPGTDLNTPTTYTAGTGLDLTAGQFSVSTVPIANGGTGATNAVTALTNLGAASLAANTFTGAQTIGTVANRTVQIAPSTNADVVEFIY